MTESQKQAVLELKNEGFSSRVIADKTGFHYEAVKTFLRRRREQEEAEFLSKSIACKECGTRFIPGRYPNQVFCTPKCRQAWWSKRKTGNRKHTCLQCGKEFKSYTNSKYCSHQCYIDHRFGRAIWVIDPDTGRPVRAVEV